MIDPPPPIQKIKKIQPIAQVLKANVKIFCFESLSEWEMQRFSARLKRRRKTIARERFIVGSFRGISLWTVSSTTLSLRF